MAYNSAHTGPEIDAAVQLLGQIQDARDSTSQDLVEVKDLAAQVKIDAGQVSAQAETVEVKASQVASNATAVEQARSEVAGATAIAVEAKDAAVASAASAQESQSAASVSEQAAAQSQLAAGLSEQVSAERAAEAVSASERTESGRIAAEASAASAAASARNAEAVVTGGTASATPGPGLLPLANAEGKINPAWMPESIARTEAVHAAANAASEALNTAAEAQARSARFLGPSPEAPEIRDDGTFLQLGDRYFNTEEQSEYLYKSNGWESNDSIVAVDELKGRISVEPQPGNIPEAGDDGLLAVSWVPSELVRAMTLAAEDGSENIGYVFGAANSKPTSVKFKIAERVSVVDFMSTEQKNDFFSGAALVDQTSALNAFWQYMKSTFVDVSSEDYLKKCGEVPSGVYRVDGSVNWTNIKARNTIVVAYGAVFYGRGATKNVIDMTGTRWLQVYGLTVFGDETNPPKNGLLLGPQNNETSGNNAFFGCNFTGHFVKTAVWNIGSETTTWVRCRAVNYNQAADAKAFIGDGRMRNGATSDYAALRAAGTAVSFTNNQFYSCDIRNVGGGSCVWLEFTRGWGFDRGCYVLSYNDANFEIWQTSTSVHQNLSIEGLMETSFQNQPVPGNTGCKYQIKFVGDGTASVLEGLAFKVGVPHAALASIKQDATSGNLSITNADLSIGHQLTVGIPVFDAPRLNLTGTIRSANATELNINAISAFNGLIISSGSGAVRPAAGVYIEINSTSGQMLLGGSGPRVYDAAYRTDGTAADVAFKGRGKGAGGAELGNEVLSNALQVQAATGSVNGLVVRGSSPGTGVRMEAFGSDNNVSLVIAPKGPAAYVITPVVNIPNYADDVAAALGGVPIGAHYRTGSTLKIRVS